MTRTLTLLLLTFLCTCVRAQMTSAVPAGYGTGSVVVNVDRDVIVVTISDARSADVRRFVRQRAHRNAPRRYLGHTVIPNGNFYDLRVVHTVNQELMDKGWILTNVNHLVDRAEEGIPFSREYFTYHYRTPPPAAPETVTVTEGTPPEPTEAVVPEALNQRMGATVRRLDDGTYELTVRQVRDGRMTEIYNLTGVGMMTADVMQHLSKLYYDGRQLVFELTPGGENYRYTFREEAGDFRFNGVRYRSGEDCGLIDYTLSVRGPQEASLVSFFRAPDDCQRALLLNPDPVIRTVAVDDLWLDNFVPGSYRLDPAGDELDASY